MADAPISGLNPIVTIDNADEFPIVDKSDTTQAGTGTTKKGTMTEVHNNLLLEGFIQEAPNDSNLYGRSALSWVSLDLSKPGIALAWEFSTNTAAGAGTGRVRYNNANPALVTEIYLSYNTTDTGADVSGILSGLTGVKIYLQVKADDTKYLVATVDTVTDNTTYYTLGVTILDSGALPAANNIAGIVVVGGSADSATNEFLSTGIITGGALSINADNTKFDVAAGSGYIVDHTVSPPTVTLVSWGAFTAQTVTNLATQFATDIGIDINGNIVQQTSYTDQQLRESIIQLGGLDHSNQTNILSTFAIQVPVQAVGSSLRELSFAIGDLNLSGNVYAPNGANLSINKSAGEVFSFGRNHVNDEQNPHKITTASDTLVSFGYVFNNGSGSGTFTAPVTTINPDQWDNGTGTLASVPVNDWSIQRILFFPNDNKTFVQYGTETFNQLQDAEIGINTTVFQPLAGIRTAMVRGYLLVRQGETNLQSANTKFVPANRFGIVVGAGGGSGAVWGGISGTLSDQTDLQAALDGKSAVGHTHVAADITDFDIEVANNPDVAANTAKVSFPGFSTLLADYGFTDNSANWDTAYNDKINSAAFNTGTGDLTLTQQDLGTVIVNLDGRYLTTETDNQTLTWTDATNNLAISGGNSVTITGFADTSHTHTAADITDFDTEVSNNTSVVANTAKVSFPGFTSLLADYGFTDNSTNWNTAFGWGDHALAGYLTGVAWGDITGTLSNQTDLQNALDGKIEGTSILPTQIAYGSATTGELTTSPNLTYSADVLRIAGSIIAEGSIGRISADEFHISPLGTSTKRWEIRNTTASNDITILLETGAGTDLWTGLYSLNNTGSPVNNTDLVTKAYGDANYSTSATIGGSIADNQIAVGAATADTIEGSSALTFDGTSLTTSGRIRTTGNEVDIEGASPRIDFTETAGTNNWNILVDADNFDIRRNGTADTEFRISSVGYAQVKGGRVYLGSTDNQALRGEDTWLRLNDAGDFTSGVYTPGAFRTDGGIDVGSSTQNDWTTTRMRLYTSSLDILRLQPSVSGNDGSYIRAYNQAGSQMWYFGRPSATGNSYTQWYSYIGLNYIRLANSGIVNIHGGGQTLSVTSTAITSTILHEAPDYSLTSDRREKQKITDYKPRKINIRYRNFEFIKTPHIKRIGVVAQELAQEHPEFVRKNPETGMLSVGYNDMIMAKLSELEFRIKQLEN